MVSQYKTCLITGASGLIGSHLINLAQQSFKVFAITRSAKTYDHPNVVNIALDLSSNFDFTNLPDKVDVLVHLAQSNQHRNFPDQDLDIASVNLTAVLRLLHYSRLASVKNFILASSGGVYGFGREPFAESSPVLIDKKSGFYLSTRIAAEILAQNYSEFFDLKILRYFFVYGPGQKSHMLIPRLCRAIIEGTEILLHGEQGMRINPIYVDDAARATLACMSCPSSFKLNIAGSQPLSVREISELIGKVVRRNPIYKVDVSSAPADMLGANDVMLSKFHRPIMNFEAGVAELCRSLEI